ncbi:Alpha/Beta hydrolase protein [Mycena alexandri]|uniref:Alpha/Beta hydrolase protein n=1 Tax=Mycena alexandri TaxID=1745969 RepID=A0AAD6XFH6_9AGAR|nr:Alpha/Beta hydrolase protein [Mycena alexandri]
MDGNVPSSRKNIFWSDFLTFWHAAWQTGPYSADADDEDNPITLRDRRSLINVKHLFGLPIWKPALYKKSRSVTRYADEALHSVPSSRAERHLLPGNIFWVIAFGWWLSLVCWYLVWPFGKYVEGEADEEDEEDEDDEPGKRESGRPIPSPRLWGAGSGRGAACMCTRRWCGVTHAQHADDLNQACRRRRWERVNERRGERGEGIWWATNDEGSAASSTVSPSSAQKHCLTPGYRAGIGFFFPNLSALAQWAGHCGSSVYAVDWLGKGRSARVPFTIKSQKKDIPGRVREAESFFIDSLEAWRTKMQFEKMTLIGHSLGGYLSVAYALKYPDRVNKLILLSPTGVPRDPTKPPLPSVRSRIIRRIAAHLPPNPPNLPRSGASARFTPSRPPQSPYAARECRRWSYYVGVFCLTVHQMGHAYCRKCSCDSPLSVLASMRDPITFEQALSVRLRTWASNVSFRSKSTPSHLSGGFTSMTDSLPSSFRMRLATVMVP